MPFRVLLACLSAMLCCVSPLVAQENSQQRLIQPAFFMANEVLPSGKRMHQSADVQAFLYSNQGTVLYGKAGAFVPVAASGKASTGGTLKSGFSAVQAHKRGLQPKLKDPKTMKVNWLRGPKSSWRTGMTVYETIAYQQVWPGIDVEYSAANQGLVPRVVAAAGANLQDVVFETGADSLTIKANGQLEARLGNVTLTFGKLRAYQRVNGKRLNVDAQYRVLEKGRFGYSLNGSYKRGEGVIIHPDMVWSTFLNFEGEQDGPFQDMAIDAAGNSYFVGNATGIDTPLSAGAYQTTYAGGASDVIVMKVDAAGTSVVYTTLLGGSNEDEAYGIAVDAAGQVAIHGRTHSNDFPVTAGSHDDSLQGSYDIFVSKLDTAGSALVFSTYLGGEIYEESRDISIDSNGDIVVTGETASSDFPTTAGAYQTSYNASRSMSFVTKFNGPNGQLQASTLLGGTNETDIKGLTVDTTDAIYVTGGALGNDFPVTGTTYGTTSANQYVFVAKLSNDLTSLTWGTVISGSSAERSEDVAVDASGNVYLVGITGSSDFPTTAGAYQETFDNSSELFVTKLAADGQSLVYSSFLGAPGIRVGGIVVDSQNRAIVAGVPRQGIATSGGGYAAPMAASENLFVSAFNGAGSDLEFTAVLGGEFDESFAALGLDPVGNIQVLGMTKSSNYPTTGGALAEAMAGSEDPFFSKLNATGDTLVYSSFLQRGERPLSYELRVDPNDQPVIVIEMASPSGFASAGSFDDSFNGATDIGILKMNAAATQIEWATFIGGQETEDIAVVDVDGSGNIYVLTKTNSNDFPLTNNAPYSELTVAEGFALAKISAAGNDLMFSSYLPGDSAQTDYGSVAAGLNDQVYVAGHTQETSFPVTKGAYDTMLNDGVAQFREDLFLTQLDTQSGSVLFSTFLGGADPEYFVDLSVDSQGRAVIAGETQSADYPVTEGAYDTIFRPFGSWRGSISREAMITKVGAQGDNLVFSTFIDHEIYDLEVDSSDQLWLTTDRQRGSLGLPTYYHSVLEDGGLVVKMNPDASAILASKYFDSLFVRYNFVLTPDSRPVFINSASGLSGPTTNGTENFGGHDLFITMLNSDLETYDYTSFLGSSSGNNLYSNAVGSDNAIFVLGRAGADDFPVTPGVFSETYQEDSLFLSKITPAGCQGPVATLAFHENQFNNPSSPITWCANYPYRFEVEAGGTGPFSYQWYKDSLAIPGANQALLEIAGQLADEGSYHCEVISSCGTAITQTYAFEVNASAPVIEVPAAMTACTGAYVRLDVQIVGGVADFRFKVDGNHYFTWMNDRAAYADFLMSPPWDGLHFVEITMNCGVMATAGTQVTWVPGSMTMALEPGTQGPGLVLPRFDLGIGCPDMQHGISVGVTPDIPFELENGVVTLSEQPTEDVVIDVTVDYGQFNPVIEATGYYLHTTSTGLLDVNGDGCNTQADFTTLAALWREAYENDGDGDQVITVRDFLYLPANNPGVCP